MGNDMNAYYNEIEPSAVLWLKAAMDAGHIAPGDVDERPIQEVEPDDLKGYTQHHFFAGIGGWSIALRLAGWPDDRPVWTGSCPCQPFSSAGQRQGQNDERHLWPVWFRLIAKYRPASLYGEQVASAIAFGWLDEVFDDLEAQGYACGAAVLPACSVGAGHRRDRLWFVAQSKNADDRGNAGEFPEAPQQQAPERQRGTRHSKSSSAGTMGNAEHDGQPATTQRGSEGKAICGGKEGQNRASEFEGAGDSGNVADAEQPGLERQPGHEQGRAEPGRNGTQADGYAGAGDTRWIECPDGKARPVEPGLCLLVDGISGRLRKAALHGYGNAIVPRVAAEFIKASQ